MIHRLSICVALLTAALANATEGQYHLLVGGSAADPAVQKLGRLMLDFAKMAQTRELRIP